MLSSFFFWPPPASSCSLTTAREVYRRSHPLLALPTVQYFCAFAAFLCLECPPPHSLCKFNTSALASHLAVHPVLCSQKPLCITPFTKEGVSLIFFCSTQTISSFCPLLANIFHIQFHPFCKYVSSVHYVSGLMLDRGVDKTESKTLSLSSWDWNVVGVMARNGHNVTVITVW